MSAPSQSAAELIARYIEPSPNGLGSHDARALPALVPVWALIGHYLATGQDPNVVAHDYDLPLESVQAALAYYDQHRTAIDGWLAINAGE